MRVRAARPRRNVQQCEQELLHSAAPILTNTPQGLNPKMLPNPSSESFFLSSTPGAPRLLNFEFNTTRRTTSEEKLLCCSTRKEVSTLVKRVLPNPNPEMVIGVQNLSVVEIWVQNQGDRVM